MHVLLRVSVFATALPLALSTAALAQTPGAGTPARATTAPAQSSASGGGGDIEVLATIVHHVTNKGEGTTYAPGWQAGASYRITTVISVIALLTGDYDSADERTSHIYTYAGGARFQWGHESRFRPFSQIVFGAGQDNGIFEPSSENNHYPVLSPGAGADIALGRAAVRLRFDVPILMRFSDSFVGTRFGIGVSVPLGGH